MRNILTRLATGASVALLMACGAATRPAGARLTPVGARMSDEAFARDLAAMAALGQRAERVGAGASGTRRYLATRAAEYVALAREAYERNDRSAFPEDLLVLAERDIRLLEQGPEAQLQGATSAVLFPNDVRLFDDAAWGRAVTLRGEADRLGAPDEIARAESILLRQGNRILAGPACMTDADASRTAARMLAAIEATRVNPVPVAVPAQDTAKQLVPERPPPAPMPDTARMPTLRRGACDAPERLTGVPASVHFALDRSVLSPASREVLDRAVEQLRAWPGVRFRLSGHTDARASNAYNQALSKRRVDAVTAYLADHGIAADRVLRAEAMGEDRLLSSGTTSRDQARNRRVDIVYVLCDGSELVPQEIIDDLQLERPRLKEK